MHYLHPTRARSESRTVLGRSSYPNAMSLNYRLYTSALPYSWDRKGSTWSSRKKVMRYKEQGRS
jgi:hypothetical protein